MNPVESMIMLVSLQVNIGLSVVFSAVPVFVYGVAISWIVSYGAIVASVIA
jgi:hypothetical protein